MQINGVIKKAALIAKKLGQAVPEGKNWGAVKTFDEVLLTTAKGKKMRILSFRGDDGKLIQRKFINENGSYIRKDYLYGECKNIEETGYFPYTQVSTVAFDKQKNPVNLIKKIISINKSDKSSVTISTMSEYGRKNGIPKYELNRLAHYEPGKRPNFLTTSVERNSEGSIVEKYVIHSKDSLPESVYQNEYIHTLQYPESKFKQEVFSHIVEREGLKGVTIKGRHYGYELGKPVQFAKYYEDERCYRFNVDAPMMDYRSFFINSTEHELKHAKQFEEIDLLKQGKLSGERARKAELYQKNFDNYVDFKENLLLYEAQIVEEEALRKGYNTSSVYNKMMCALEEKFKKANLLFNQIGINDSFVK
jgi:hypothetical protein